MRKNPVKAALAAGKRAYGAMVFEFFSPGIAQICRNAGAEFVLYDMEHTGLSFETLKLQFALCRGLDVVPMVRVPRGEYHFIARALDVGALGVMVPMVGSAEEAAHIVACTRYPPAGRRGAAFGFAHDDYQGGDVATKIAAIHERTLVIPQIETVEGLANVDAIAAVPGVDALWLGHFDLTNFMGIPGEFQHPDYLAAVKRIVAACERHGKAAGFLATDDDLGARIRRLRIPAIRLRRRPVAAAERVDARPRPPAQGSCRQWLNHFRVGITRDILDSRGEPAFGRAALAILDNAPNVEWEYLPEIVRELTPEHARALRRRLRQHGAHARGRRVAPECRLRVVARHGVGYDSVDVPAMTRAGVLVTNTPMPMPRPVATIALTFILALAGKLMLKDRLTRTGRWDERMDNMGMGLTGRTLGVVGAGRIGKELLRMARVFDLKLLAADPYVNAVELGYVGARKVDLDTLLREVGLRRHHSAAQRRDAASDRRPAVRADEAHRLFHQRVARTGGRRAGVDRGAARRAASPARRSTSSSRSRWTRPIRCSRMDNVIVTPHSLCWTDECFHNMAATGLASIVDALSRRVPEFVVNREVLEHPRVRAWFGA